MKALFIILLQALNLDFHHPTIYVVLHLRLLSQQQSVNMVQKVTHAVQKEMYLSKPSTLIEEYVIQVVNALLGLMNRILPSLMFALPN